MVSGLLVYFGISLSLSLLAYSLKSPLKSPICKEVNEHAVWRLVITSADNDSCS